MHYNTLPVSPEQIDDRWFMNDLPWSVGSFHVNAPMSDNLRPMVPLIAGILLYELQQTAHLSPIHTFTYNLLASNFRNNREFTEALLATIEWVELQLVNQNVHPNDGDRIESIIGSSVGTIANIFRAMYVNQYEELHRYISESDFHATQGWLQYADDMQQQIAAYKQHRYGGNNQQPYNQGAPQHYSGGRTFDPPPQQQKLARSSSLAFGANKASQTPPATNQRPSAFGSRPSTAVKGSLSGMAEAKPTTVPVFGSLRKSTPTVNPHKEALEGALGKPKNTQTIIPLSSGKTRALTPERPYAFVYNPKMEVPFLTPDSNNQLIEGFFKLQEVTKMGLDLDYFKHELNTTFSAAVKRDENDRPDAAITVPIIKKAAQPLKFTQAQLMVKEAKEENPDEGGDIGPISIPVIIDEPIVANTLRDSLGEAEKLLHENGMDTKDFVEYVFMEEHLYVVEEEEKVALSALTAFALDDSPTLPAIADVLYALKDKVSDRFWYDIQNDFTKMVLEVLVTSIPLKGWKISSFVDDMEELIKLMNEHKGEELTTIFCENTADLICAYLNNIDVVEEEGSNEILIRVRIPCVVSRIPILAGELDIAMNEKAGAVLQSRFPILYDSLRNIYRRNESTFCHRFIITRDNVVLKLYSGWLQDNTYLLGKAD